MSIGFWLKIHGHRERRETIGQDLLFLEDVYKYKPMFRLSFQVTWIVVLRIKFD